MDHVYNLVPKEYDSSPPHNPYDVATEITIKPDEEDSADALTPDTGIDTGIVGVDDGYGAPGTNDEYANPDITSEPLTAYEAPIALPVADQAGDSLPGEDIRMPSEQNYKPRDDPMFSAQPEAGQQTKVMDRFDATDMHSAQPETVEHPELDSAVVPQERIKFRFVECEHTPQNARRIAEALDGCETVVFEFAGGQPANRQIFESAINLMLHPDTPPETYSTHDKYLRKAGAHYIADTVKHMPDSVKRARLFDIDADHTITPDVQELHRREIILGWVIKSNAPNNAQRWALANTIAQSAITSPDRENHMAMQLAAIARQEAALEPHTVGVVTGIDHEGTRRQIDSAGFDCTDVAISSRVHPPLYLKIEREYDPRLPIDPIALDRSLLEEVLHYYRYDPSVAYTFPATASDQTITSLMGELEQVKLSGKPPDEKQSDVKDVLHRAVELFEQTTTE